MRGLMAGILLSIFDFIFTPPPALLRGVDSLGDVPYVGVAGGLDDWEVEIEDFVVLLGKDAKKVHGSFNSPGWKNGSGTEYC